MSQMIHPYILWKKSIQAIFTKHITHITHINITKKNKEKICKEARERYKNLFEKENKKDA